MQRGKDLGDMLCNPVTSLLNDVLSLSLIKLSGKISGLLSIIPLLRIFVGSEVARTTLSVDKRASHC